MNTQADRDLFGVPLDPHHGRKGRPRHKPTEDMRRRVRELREGGATLPMIAAALHITEPTLARHYRNEIGARAAARRARSEDATVQGNEDGRNAG
jgi:DNA invertase Pin-like site-specific DNA recombinase